MTDPEASHEDTGPPSKFTDWPENLPREELIRLLRGYGGMCVKVEQAIAAKFPDEYPLGDGGQFDTGERMVVFEDAVAMAEKAAGEINRLRAENERLIKKYDGMNHIASLAIDSLNRLAGYPTDYAHGDTYEAALKRMREAG